MLFFCREITSSRVTCLIIDFYEKIYEERFLSQIIASSFFDEIKYREDSRVSKSDAFEY